MLTNRVSNTFGFNFLRSSVFRLFKVGFLQILVMKHSVSNLVNCRFYRLRLGHTLFNGNCFIFLIEKAFC